MKSYISLYLYLYHGKVEACHGCKRLERHCHGHAIAVARSLYACDEMDIEWRGWCWVKWIRTPRCIPWQTALCNGLLFPTYTQCEHYVSPVVTVWEAFYHFHDCHHYSGLPVHESYALTYMWVSHFRPNWDLFLEVTLYWGDLYASIYSTYLSDFRRTSNIRSLRQRTKTHCRILRWSSVCWKCCCIRKLCYQPWRWWWPSRRLLRSRSLRLMPNHQCHNDVLPWSQRSPAPWRRLLLDKVQHLLFLSYSWLQ